MNALDRVIAAVSPQTAVKRAAARRKLDILDSGYGNYGASHTKKSLAGWLYGGGSAKEDIQDNLSTLRQRCRDLYMGVPLATGALKTCRTNVIGSGLRLKSGNFHCGPIRPPATLNGLTTSTNCNNSRF